MKKTAAILTLFALTLVPFAFASESPEPPVPTVLADDPVTVAPEAQLTLDPTDDALFVDDVQGCPVEDVRGTSFDTQDPDPQACMDFCASNGWSFLAYGPADREGFLCFCCAD